METTSFLLNKIQIAGPTSAQGCFTHTAISFMKLILLELGTLHKSLGGK